MAVEVRQLREGDDRTKFRPGDDDLDRFFVRYAGQNQFRLHIGTTYVAVDGETIVGYVTVASCSIDVAGLPRKLAKRLPTYPIPALRLARMAVAQGLQRGGIGTLLMKAVFTIARDQARRSGCAFVVVDAKPGAESYYQRWGFEALPVEAGEIDARPMPQPMFLEIGAIPATDEALPGS
ncbi:MAG: GNAT family N-acetyltransferase [Deltaproteobacteria bacterium]|nr:MAG: GNAT family N-acetyltransferase [Deltaproteobacteria bacterium]